MNSSHRFSAVLPPTRCDCRRRRSLRVSLLEMQIGRSERYAADRNCPELDNEHGSDC